MKMRFVVKRIFVLMVMVSLLTASFAIDTHATEIVSETTITSNNIHDHVYSENSRVSNSYMCVNPDGSISRIENFGDIILNERYDSSGKMLSQSTIPYELPLFGGFYSGSTYNYFVFGDTNTEESNYKECVRIVRYSKNWQRIDSCPVSWINTTVPFTDCNTSFSEYGDLLYIRAGHTTYKDSKGKTHQSVMTLTYCNSTGKMYSHQTMSGNEIGAPENVGATFIDATYGNFVAVDHLVDNPYMINSIRVYGKTVNNNSYCGKAQFMGTKDALTKAVPKFTIGGMSSSTQDYIIVGTSESMDGTSSSKNIFVATMPKAQFNQVQLNVSYMTGYAYNEPTTTTTPYIVKVNEDKFVLLWEEKEGYSDTGKVSYLYLDGYGRRLGDVHTTEGCLSDCEPVVYGNRIVWYTTDGKSVKICSVPVDGSTYSGVYNDKFTGTYDISLIYNYQYYMSTYPDVRVLYFNNEDAAFEQFIRTGIAEGRQGCEEFNVKIYRQNYPDLDKLYGDNWVKYYIHYLTVGYYEGRTGKNTIKK